MPNISYFKDHDGKLIVKYNLFLILINKKLISRKLRNGTIKQYKDIKQIALLFLKLGIISFGGLAEHIAIIEDEVVYKRKWVDQQHLLDLIGLTNLIPGPNSTKMAIHIGFCTS